MPLHRILLSLAFLAAISGCTVAPRPVYRAYPVEGTDIWNNGKEVVSADEGGLEMAMAFETYINGLLVFQMEFVNRSQSRLTVDPAQFHFTATRDSTGAASHVMRFHAVDPESHLLQNDRARSRQIARREEEKSNDGLFDFLDLVADIASAGDEKTEEEKQTEIAEDQEIELTRLREAQEHEAAMQAINAGRYRWTKDTLRKTTLLPGQCIGGRVRFRPSGQGEFLTFVFPVDDLTLESRYRLVKHTVARH